MIPTYMAVRSYGLIDTIWALILPGAVPVFSVVLMLNFFRQLPKAVEEAAFIDGAGYFRTL
jgi:putative aldouronate transport system permease protein